MTNDEETNLSNTQQRTALQQIAQHTNYHIPDSIYDITHIQDGGEKMRC